jgi:hypothetical protein
VTSAPSARSMTLSSAGSRSRPTAVARTSCSDSTQTARVCESGVKAPRLAPGVVDCAEDRNRLLPSSSAVSDVAAARRTCGGQQAQ